MFFNSLIFLIFFCITTIIYFLIKGKNQRYYLILISFVFYSYFIPWHTIILIFIVFINYLYGILYPKISDKYKKSYLILFLVINITSLISFKYINFIDENILALANLLDWNYSLHYLKILVPLGLSFYIFKCISYNIEVYRKKIPPEKNADIFSLYIIIYPELISGPIDRPQNLIPQLYKEHKFDYDRVASGLKLIAWGYFQKWLIADRLALVVNDVFGNLNTKSELSYLIAAFFYSIQIYCDFSAYSDIAIGTGRILGYKFTNNFNLPYFSRNISEFWSRWHISLSTWLRDYLFLPLAYYILRQLKNKPLLNISPEIVSYSGATIITMFIAGLWHGAGLNYIVWGLLMGMYLIFSFSTKKFRRRITKLTGLSSNRKLHKIISVVITFTLITFAWIFFRAENINAAFIFINNLLNGLITYSSKIPDALFSFNIKLLLDPIFMGYKRSDILLNYFFIILFFLIQYYQSKVDIIKFISEKNLYIRWAVYLLLIYAIMIFGKFEHREFIYAQF